MCQENKFDTQKWMNILYECVQQNLNENNEKIIYIAQSEELQLNGYENYVFHLWTLQQKRITKSSITFMTWF
jgi:hypothetical protein